MDTKKYGPWALIVGGSEGLGEAFADKLAASGFKLVLVARTAASLQKVAESLRGRGAEVRTQCVDLSQPGALQQVRQVTDTLEVGLLVFVAGPLHQSGFFVDLPEAEVDAAITVNALAPAAFARHYGAQMCQRGRGGMITTGSIGGYVGSPMGGAYTASKAFIRTLSEALWAECKSRGVDVLHVLLGLTATPSVARLLGGVAVGEPVANVAQESLDNIANGPLWIVSTPGNREQALSIAGADRRPEIIDTFVETQRKRGEAIMREVQTRR